MLTEDQIGEYNKQIEDLLKKLALAKKEIAELKKELQELKSEPEREVMLAKEEIDRKIRAIRQGRPFQL
jgi:predicted  nucleic acid-binding Zn-ribbon protein